MSSYETPELSDDLKNLGKDKERADSGIYKDEADKVPSESMSPDEALMHKEIIMLAHEALKLEHRVATLSDGDSEKDSIKKRLDIIYSEIGQDFDFDSLDELPEEAAAPVVAAKQSVVKTVIAKVKAVVAKTAPKENVQPAVKAQGEKKIIPIHELVFESDEKKPNEIEKMKLRISELAPGDGMIGVLERRIEKAVGEIKDRIEVLKKQMEGLAPEDGRIYVNNLRIKALEAELPTDEASRASGNVAA